MRKTVQIFTAVTGANTEMTPFLPSSVTAALSALLVCPSSHELLVIRLPRCFYLPL
jgi:hypothetical protein